MEDDRSHVGAAEETYGSNESGGGHIGEEGLRGSDRIMGEAHGCRQRHRH